MIKKRIPNNFEFNWSEVEAAIRSVTGPDVMIELCDRIVTIHADLSAAQKLQIKDSVLPLLTDVQDITT